MKLKMTETESKQFEYFGFLTTNFEIYHRWEIGD